MRLDCTVFRCATIGVGLLVTIASCGSSDASVEPELPPVEDNPRSSFSFEHDPISVSLPALRPNERASLESADVPVGTLFFVPSSSPAGTDVGSAEVRIIDYMRGSESSQQITLQVNGVDGNPLTIVTNAPSGACSASDVQQAEIRESAQACVDDEGRQLWWSEEDHHFTATAIAEQVLSDDLLDWVNQLEAVMLGAEGPPYQMPYCADAPGRCSEE